MAKHRVARESVVQPLDQSYRLIPLTQNQVAKVSEEDFEVLSQWIWHAYWNDHTKSFYACRKLPRVPGHARVQIWMHRQILGLEYGDRRQGDHQNHDTLDNRRDNLRIATRHEQQANTRRQKNNRSGLKGAHWSESRKSWTSQILHDGKKIWLGVHATAELAHAAYCEAAQRLKGDFAHL